MQACNRQVGNWPRLLPYALWADRTTHNSVTGYMPIEVMFGQKPVISVEQTISSRRAIDWLEDMSREEMLAARIRQLERRLEEVD